MDSRKPNIAVIVIDSARYPEFMHSFNSMKAQFNKLGEFVALERCIAPASWTLPSHASLFTGMYPSEHGSHETKTIKALDIDEIKLRKPTLLEDLKAIGYKTYGISANPYIHPIYGFTGFDKFKEETYFTDMQGNIIEIPKRLKPLISKYRAKYGSSVFKIGFGMLRDDPALITEITGLPLTGFLTLKNIAKRFRMKLIEGWPVEKGGMNALSNFISFSARQPFFFFLNLMEAHEPYVGKKGMDFDWPTPFLKEQPSKDLINLWKSKYKVGIGKGLSYAYNIASYLLSKYPNTAIIITSDHGQEFGEHNFIGHGVRLDDELIHIPFIVHLPEWAKLIESKKYSSLVNVRAFIGALARLESDAMSLLYSEMVYAESFGTQSNLSNIKSLGKKIDQKKLKLNDRYRKRVFRS
ncbi:MAG: sulfatase-like hydrolase/transferase [Candidatus Micrarchaeia archaeon]